ncbi:MAG: hypothetical protein VB071_01510 [Lawsonibacter sp.]|nr:hypothetical protein [Lawsonibacter sp.]
MAQYPHIRVFYGSDGLVEDKAGVSLMPYYLIEYLDEMLFFEFT